MSSVARMVRDDRYQVFLMTSPASMPINFACHPWFVVNQKGALSRWELVWGGEGYRGEVEWGHLMKNMLKPFEGLRAIHLTDKYHWNGTLVKVIEGDESSLAARMTRCIEQSPKSYPHKDEYSFLGPNSNTYVQWVLNQFPESGMHLPWNAIGKNTQ